MLTVKKIFNNIVEFCTSPIFEEKEEAKVYSFSEAFEKKFTNEVIRIYFNKYGIMPCEKAVKDAFKQYWEEIAESNRG